MLDYFFWVSGIIACVGIIAYALWPVWPYGNPRIVEKWLQWRDSEKTWRDTMG